MRLFMVMVTPSTYVTGCRTSNSNSVPCDIVGRICICVDGSAVEFSPPTRQVRARFPDGADYIFTLTPRKYM